MFRKALGLLAAAVSFGVAQSASAADMPIKAPPAAVMANNWTGFYVGANGGYAWAKKDWFDVLDTASLGSHTAVGWVLGGQIGYDFQTGPWVFGIRGMYDWADLNGSNVVPGGTNIMSTNVRSFATAVGRVGYLFEPNTLVYGLGGGAWAWDRYKVSTGAGVEFGNATETKSGYVVGMGLEHKFSRNWSVFAEYDYLRCGCVVPVTTTTILAPPLVPGGVVPTGAVPIDIKQHLSIILVGINYRFGGL